MIWYSVDCAVMVFSFLMIYAVNKFHIMNNVIFIEFISVSLIFFLSLFCTIFNKELYFSVFVLVVFVSESVIVVSSVVSMIRLFGNDYLSSLLVGKV